jgi:large subunit ribosomal protein L7e
MVSTQLKPRVDGEALKVAKVVLKRRDRNLKANAERAKAIQQIRKLRKSKAKVISAVTGDQLLRKCKRIEMDKQHVIIAKNKKTLERKIPEGTSSLLVARNMRQPELQMTKNALVKLGVFKMNDCRIIAATPANLSLIRQSDAYLYYGVPTPEIISTLVHKKAHIKQAKESVPLNNNAVVEDVLGEFGLICVEDMVDVLVKGKDDERFEKVNQFITPFRMNPENKQLDSRFKNSRLTRGFQPNIETIMNRII